MDPLFYSPVDPAHIKRERAKARELRQSAWWKEKLSRGVCHYCENKFTRDQLTMDHIVPVGRGGLSKKGNVVVCCKTCNTNKAHQTPAELALQSLKTI